MKPTRVKACIPYAAEISKATSGDKSRPVLTGGWIEHDGQGSWLAASDSYILARIPIEVGGLDFQAKVGTPIERDAPVERRRELLPEVLIPAAAMKVFDKSSCFQFEDGLLRIEGHDSLFELPEGSTRPNAGELIAAAFEDDVFSRTAIVFAPENLARVSAAIGAHSKGVVLEFRGPRKAIRVINPAEDRAKGLLMPMRAMDS